MATATLARQIGRAITNSTSTGNGWFNPIPLSSEFDQLRNHTPLLKRIILFNKMDPANPSQLKDWMKYFEQNNRVSYGVNAHNNESIQQIASHPNIYVLDSPGVLPPHILDDDVCTKLALTDMQYTVHPIMLKKTQAQVYRPDEPSSNSCTAK
ncbi:hypothetical protein C1H46_004006 [Malus baccata]|uniref:G domain-containing protein n=1 Tax=Malus baccata TaxID=106549 RepID=A0A540NHC3_MALBA|nr:hypothetical protein C1H46_004006 [Malus baccata]